MKSNRDSIKLAILRKVPSEGGHKSQIPLIYNYFLSPEYVLIREKCPHFFSKLQARLKSILHLIYSTSVTLCSARVDVDKENYLSGFQNQSAVQCPESQISDLNRNLGILIIQRKKLPCKPSLSLSWFAVLTTPKCEAYAGWVLSTFIGSIWSWVQTGTRCRW